MKFNGYRKNLMPKGKENANTNAYDAGYNQGQKDLFVPMAAIGIVCCVFGWIFGMVV